MFFLINGVCYRYDPAIAALRKVAGYDFGNPRIVPGRMDLEQHFADHDVAAITDKGQGRVVLYGNNDDDYRDFAGYYYHPSLKNTPGEQEFLENTDLRSHSFDSGRHHYLAFSSYAPDTSNHVRAVSKLMNEGDRLIISPDLTDEIYYHKKNGELKPWLPTPEESKRAEHGRKALDAEFRQFLSYRPIDEYDEDDIEDVNQESFQHGDEAIAHGDQWVGRQNQPRKPWHKPPSGDHNHYFQRGREWAASRGFNLDEGANGFTASQTAHHDAGHPIVHDMLGTNSEELGKFLHGEHWDGSDLSGEEAIVNIAEHMAHGDGFNASRDNGFRLARTLSRGSSNNGLFDHIRNSPDFYDRLNHLARQIYSHPHYGDYMKILRRLNLRAGTVTQSGFTVGPTSGG